MKFIFNKALLCAALAFSCMINARTISNDLELLQKRADECKALIPRLQADLENCARQQQETTCFTEQSKLDEFSHICHRVYELQKKYNQDLQNYLNSTKES